MARGRGERLSDGDRAAVQQLLNEGWAVQDIAEVAGITTGSVYRIRRVMLGHKAQPRRPARARIKVRTGIRVGKKEAWRRNADGIDREQLLGVAGSAPFALLPEILILGIEYLLWRNRQIHFIMTHGGDGLPLYPQPVNGEWATVPTVHAFHARAHEPDVGEADPDPLERRDPEPCRVSYDGGRTWTVFTPGESKVRKDQPRTKTPWRKLAHGDLKAQGLEAA